MAPSRLTTHQGVPISDDQNTLTVGDRSFQIHRLDALQAQWDVARLPYTLRILLENVLRNGSREDVEAVAGWVATDEPSREISFAPARVLLQDFTGVPAVVDLAAMRNAMADFGGDPEQIKSEALLPRPPERAEARRAGSRAKGSGGSASARRVRRSSDFALVRVVAGVRDSSSS